MLLDNLEVSKTENWYANTTGDAALFVGLKKETTRMISKLRYEIIKLNNIVTVLIQKLAIQCWSKVVEFTQSMPAISFWKFSKILIQLTGSMTGVVWPR